MHVHVQFVVMSPLHDIHIPFSCLVDIWSQSGMTYPSESSSESSEDDLSAHVAAVADLVLMGHALYLLEAVKTVRYNGSPCSHGDDDRGEFVHTSSK